MASQTSRSAVILARDQEDDPMPSRFFDVDGRCSLLECILDSVLTVTDEIYIVFNHEPDLRLVECVVPFGVKITIDEGSLVSNMVNGLRASRSENCLVVPSNLPFLKPNVAFVLFEASRGHDAAIPRWSDGRIEPTIAAYRKGAFLKAVGQSKGVGSPEDIVSNLYAVRFVDIEGELKQLDPELNSFFTVRSPGDLEKAKQMATMRSRF